VGYELKRAQQALRGRMDEALRPLGLSTPQYAALTALEAQPGLSNAELARAGFVTPQTMNAIVAGLAGGGLVERRPHPSHGRVLTTELTPRGAKLLAEAHPRVAEIEQRMTAPLSPEQRHQLLAGLRACADALA
jgi:DNA-binding MarR family transcriptional regulator